jgi:hypothetical protein
MISTVHLDDFAALGLLVGTASHGPPLPERAEIPHPGAEAGLGVILRAAVLRDRREKLRRQNVDAATAVVAGLGASAVLFRAPSCNSSRLCMDCV